ncbi:hypothetical protein [Streptomyces sp. NPDC127038]|uniref:hypothetical protein n=1 Tax=Streptomyces sp. NPDC127038 TaxID=3347114 RepID=UPI003666E453
MEQRIGSKSQPLDAAAVNPAYIPGLTSPVPAEPEDAVVDAEETTAEEEVTAEETVSGEAPAAGTSEESVPEEKAVPEEESAPADAPEPVSVPDGPVFEASDRRASIRADHSGVLLRLDDQEAEFRWDEIGAVETESPRFGKRFTITVHTPERRWYPIEIEANARARFKEWEEQLDAVLDAYFEDGDEAGAAEDSAVTAEPEATPDSDAEPEDSKADDSKAEDSKDSEDSKSSEDSEAGAVEAAEKP